MTSAVPGFDAFLPRLFSYGFRPLFLCAALSGPLLVALWIAALRGWLPGFAPALPLVTWHGHEMLFGFVGAAIGGFLLTAVANWTRRPPVAGLRLALLVVAWLAARVVFAADPELGPMFLLAIDVAYWLLLALFLGVEVVAARNRRNYPIVVIVALFVVLVVLFHADAVFGAQLGSQAVALRGMLGLVCLLIAVIAGRIVPAFTANWLRARGGLGPGLAHGTAVPAAFGPLDGIAVAGLAGAALAYAMAPRSALTGVLLLAAGVLQLLRLARWQGHRTFPEPLLLVLHAGYGWLGLGLVLLGSGVLWPAIAPGAGLHGIAVGAMAGLIVAVSSRAALGHTNRPLRAGPALTTAFVLLQLAALARVATDWFGAGWLYVAAGLWIAAFLVYLGRLAPVLLGAPRRIGGH